MISTWVRVDDPSRVGEVRRSAVALAAEEGISDAEAGPVAIVATEAATNLLKHAGGGEIQISVLSAQGAPGVEILSVDQGPGMASVEECLRDGFSTGGSAGTGFGAIRRLSHEFDVYSGSQKGTVLVSRIYRDPAICSPGLGAILSPMRGEHVCGDAWGIRRNGGGRTIKILVADGLGHGILAADASSVATEVFKKDLAESPLQIVDTLHRALKGTRGAAIAVAAINLEERRVRYAGLGNIAGVVLGSKRPSHLVSHNGTAGHQASRIQEFEYALPESGILVMHSDGLTSSWSLDAYPGLLRKHPSVIAGVLYRDASRRRDDVGVVVLAFEAA